MGEISTQRKSVKFPTPIPKGGRKQGKKRKDYHWEDPTGQIWDSRFEYLFYTAASEAGLKVARCDKSHTFSFTLPIRGGACRSCSSTDVGQLRHYTPDFFVVPSDTEHPGGLHYIETKGYLRAKERSLLRAWYKAHPDTNLSFILQRSYRATKPGKSGDGSITSWLIKFLPNVRVYLWDGTIPNELKNSQSTPQVNPRASAKPKKRALKRRV
jgi:hypothetical protein